MLPVSPVRKQIEGRIQMLERANASEKLVMTERQSMLQFYYQTDQISLFDYYAGRKIAQDAALAQTLGNFQKEITAWQQYQGHYKEGSKEYVDAANKIAAIRDKVSATEQEGAKQSTMDWLQQQQAVKQYENKLTDLQAKLAEMRGDKGMAAGIQFDLGNASFVNQLNAIANSSTASVEEIGVDSAVIEHQLAHKVPDALGDAYNRTKFIAQRWAMMQQWADYLDKLKVGAEIIPISGQAA
jgi:hypothetical protein